MTSYKVESGVPLPAKGNARRCFPFAEMKVGDSFVAAHIGCVAAAGVWKKRNPGWDYTSRKQNGGFRIWRTA
jgi:hypothetical protein